MHERSKQRPHIRELCALKSLRIMGSVSLRMLHLKVAGEGLQVHCDIEGLIQCVHNIPEHGPLVEISEMPSLI